MASNHVGWWSNKNFVDLGQGSLEPVWAATALGQDALEKGQILYDNSIVGVSARSMEDVVKDFQALGGRVVVDRPKWRGDTAIAVMLVWPNSCVMIWDNDGDMEARCITSDLNFYKSAQQIIENSIGPKASSGRVYVLVSTEEGPKLQSIGVASVPLERGNYNEEVLEAFDAVVTDLKSNDPNGRLAVFDGVPGTGKTYLIRGLLSAVPDALFVLVPVSLIEQLANPSMISALLETRRNKGDQPTVFLIEDADDCLGSRDATNVNAVSALLNLGDGIIGALMDIRLVCTTNLKNEELDQAVTRPGRLSRKVSVGYLDRKIAEALYEKLTGRKVRIDEKLTLAQVYSMARDNGWKPPEKKRAVGFMIDGYELPISFVDTLKSRGQTDPEIHFSSSPDDCPE